MYLKGQKAFEDEQIKDKTKNQDELDAIDKVQKKLILGGNSLISKFCLDMAGSGQSFDEIVADYIGKNQV